MMPQQWRRFIFSSLTSFGEEDKHSGYCDVLIEQSVCYTANVQPVACGDHLQRWELVFIMEGVVLRSIRCDPIVDVQRDEDAVCKAGAE